MNNKIHKTKAIQSFKQEIIPIINSSDKKIIREEWLKYIQNLYETGLISKKVQDAWMVAF